MRKIRPSKFTKLSQDPGKYNGEDLSGIIVNHKKHKFEFSEQSFLFAQTSTVCFWSYWSPGITLGNLWNIAQLVYD